MLTFCTCGSATNGADAAAAAAQLALLDAIRWGKQKHMLELLQSGVSLHVQQGPEGHTALHTAAERGRSQMVILLIQHGADAEALSDDGSRPLHLAARQGHAAAATALLDAHADVNSRDNSGRTPFHVAVQSGQADMMQLLLDAGADVEAADYEGLTPLHLASSIYQHQPASLLLAAGADVATKCAAGNTPLHYACQHRSVAVVRVLLGAGAAVDAVNKEGVTPLDAACSHGYDDDARVVDALLDSGAQLTIPNNHGYIPLHAAAAGNHIRMATCLLRASSAPEHVNATGHDGSPLHLAVLSGHGRMVALLLAAGADVEARDAEGFTPLHDAVVKKRLLIVKQLLAAGADPGAVDDIGILPLHIAAQQGHTAILQVLLAAMAAGQGSAAVDAGLQGATALILAAEEGHTSCVRLLLAAVADPGAADGEGALPLHRAAQQGHTAILQMLLAAGQGSVPVDVQASGITALAVATEGGHIGCMRLLLAAGADPSKPFGAGATNGQGGNLAGGTCLHRAVGKGQTELVPLLATPASMRQTWHGLTPLHVALAVEGRVIMAQALVTAGSPAWVANPDGITAMSLAADSKDAAIRALLPAMVRGECERYKQQQQQQGGVDHQQQLKRLEDCLRQLWGKKQGIEQQQDPAAVLAAVVDAVYVLLKGSRIASSEKQDTFSACVQSIMDVLEAAIASHVMQLVLSVCKQIDARGDAAAAAAAAGVGERYSCCMQLATALSRGCSAALEPLMQQRWGLTNRLQQLVAAASQQSSASPQRRRSGAAGAQATQQQAVTEQQLAAQAMEAAHGHKWQQFVQLWDQLQGRQPALACRLLDDVQQQQRQGTLAGAGRLCLALLEAWAAAQQQVAVRKQQELAEAVVGAVQAAQQRAVEGGRGRRGRGRSTE
jgi:ankyrin repeat protein